MRCEKVRDMLLDGLAGPGGPFPGEVADHLAGCAACRRLQAELVASWAMLDSFPCPEASASFDQAVWARIRKTEAPAGHSRHRFLPSLARHAWVVGSLAAACLVVAVGVLLAVYGGAGKNPAEAAGAVAEPARGVLPPVPKAQPKTPDKGAAPAEVVAEADEDRLLEEIDELLGADPGSVADPAYVETPEEPGNRSQSPTPAGGQKPSASPRGGATGVSGMSAADRPWPAGGICRQV